VRVGFLTHLLWDRYGPFWETLVRSVGAEVVHADRNEVVARLADARVSEADALVFKLAIAASLALDDVDCLVVPQLLVEDGTSRGAAQDPWIAALPMMLERSVPGLPAVVGVPVRLDGEIETLAVSFLRRLTGDVGAIRRAWSTHRLEVRPPRRPATAATPAGVLSSALLGSPWWATERVLAATPFAGEPSVGPWQFPPEVLREEGLRSDPKLADSDAEALGALRRLARSGSIGRLRWLTDENSGSDAWLLRRARGLVGERLEVVSVQQLGDAAHWASVLLGGGEGEP
jgi:hypothetical protein